MYRDYYWRIFLRDRVCRWFVQQVITIMGILSSILFIDEAIFDRDGIINLHNRHLWATDSPHGMVEMSHQQRLCNNGQGLLAITYLDEFCFHNA